MDLDLGYGVMLGSNNPIIKKLGMEMDVLLVNFFTSSMPSM